MSKVIVAGSRSILEKCSDSEARRHVSKAIEGSGFDVSTIVSGTARGVDRLGEYWAYDQDEWIDIDEFPAPWDETDHPDAVVKTRQDGTEYDARAGHRRNEEMAKAADKLVLVWDMESSGSRSMLELGLEYLGPENVVVYNFVAGEFVDVVDIDL